MACARIHALPISCGVSGYRSEIAGQATITFETGTKLGRYEICAQPGAGRMGEAYLAQDTILGRKLALKILPAHGFTCPL